MEDRTHLTWQLCGDFAVVEQRESLKAHENSYAGECEGEWYDKLAWSQMEIKMLFFFFPHRPKNLQKQTQLSVFMFGLICSLSCVFLGQLKLVNAARAVTFCWSFMPRWVPLAGHRINYITASPHLPTTTDFWLALLLWVKLGGCEPPAETGDGDTRKACTQISREVFCLLNCCGKYH